MRFSKSLFLAFAGLGLFACSNEDVVENGVQGNATVTVNIEDVISRALAAPSTGTNGQEFAVVLKDAKLILEAGAGGKEIPVTDLQDEYTFSGVRNPSKIIFINNGGLAAGLELKNVVNTGLAEPLYAESTSFTRVDEENYKVTLQPEHRLALLQFSGVKHDDKGAECKMETATLDGVFLNGAALVEGKTATQFISATEGDEAENVWETITTTWTDTPVFDAVTDGTTFLTDQNGWPHATGEGATQCYAYNIIPAGEGETVTTLPKFTIALSNVSYKAGVVAPQTTVRFAKVANYKMEGDFTGDKEAAGIADDGIIKAFKAGYIYNITGLAASDEDFGTTPEGGKDATVTATVTVTPWKLINATVDWE